MTFKYRGERYNCIKYDKGNKNIYCGFEISILKQKTFAKSTDSDYDFVLY